MKSPRTYVFMGVSGCGKSAVAKAVERALDCAFLDGDFLHPRSNIEKMASGMPLDDADRAPWLDAICDAAFAMQRVQPISLIVCSALKKTYRDRLRQGIPSLQFIHLHGEFDLIEVRLAARQGHFQKPVMLASQFAALEMPGADESDVLCIDIAPQLDAVVAAAIRAIHSRQE